jgi:predicted nicotinamide N-methyase
MESIRADTFEDAYAVRWLTALVAQKTTLRCDDEDDGASPPDPEVETLVQSAAALLAVCAGAASAGTRARTYVLCGVRVQLTDVALRNDDFASVGAQTWGSACVLAEMIAEAPPRFGLCCTGHDDDDDGAHLVYRGGGGTGLGTRVLELGAGTGLVSLTVGRILEKSYERDDSQRGGVIVASDFHPTALENLRLNIQRNFPLEEDGTDSEPGHDLSISAHFLDWEDAADPTRALQAPFDEPFDEVFGADIVYELEHAMWIKACLTRVLRLTGRFHLVIPLRERFARESATVERVFPRVEDMLTVTEVGPTLCITQKEGITCEAWPDGKGEVEYVHYTIQWAVGGDR